MVVLQLAIALCLTAFTAFSLWKRVVYMNYGTFRRDEEPRPYWFAIALLVATVLVWLVIALFSPP
jgi:hypothetical protein